MKSALSDHFAAMGVDYHRTDGIASAFVDSGVRLSEPGAANALLNAGMSEEDLVLLLDPYTFDECVSSLVAFGLDHNTSSALVARHLTDGGSGEIQHLFGHIAEITTSVFIRKSLERQQKIVYKTRYFAVHVSWSTAEMLASLEVDEFIRFPPETPSDHQCIRDVSTPEEYRRLLVEAKQQQRALLCYRGLRVHA